jgi:DNA-binding transcriptional MerR regulator
MAARTTSTDEQLLTIDELALSTGLTVRTTRYYASLGLLPAPIRRGRMAYYGPEHLARLELIRALQEHGFTLAAIERHLASVPMSSSVDEIAVQRALITAWHPGPVETMTRAQLDDMAGRPLTPDDVDDLVRIGMVMPTPDGEFDVLPLTREAVETLDLGTPVEAIVEANAAVRRHMGELADELTRILRDRVIPRLQDGSGDPDRIDRAVTHLRSLTLDAIVLGFQRAANHVALRSLTLDGAEAKDETTARREWGQPSSEPSRRPGPPPSGPPSRSPYSR